MPRAVRLRPGHRAKSSEIAHMMHPTSIIKYNWPNKWQRDRVEVLVVVGQDFRVVRRGSPATNAFIMRHEYLPNKELYDTNRMVHIT